MKYILDQWIKEHHGQSYQISKYWSKLLEKSCLWAQCNKIEKEKDIYGIIVPKYITNIDENAQKLDLNNISELLYKCKVHTDDMHKLKNLWNLDLTKEGEERE